MTASDKPDWTTALFRDDSGVNTTITCSIYAGFPSNPGSSGTATDISQLELQFTGIIDQYTIKLLADEVTFECRSLGAPLTSNKITTTLLNGKTTDFIQAQCNRFGIGYNIQTPYAPLSMQTILQDELIAGAQNIVVWDLMLRCAVWDDCDCWVDSSGVLNYVAPFNINRNALDIEWGRDLTDAQITHSPQFSKNIQVEVRAATSKIRTSAVTRYTANADGSVSQNNYSTTSTTQPIYGTTQVLTQTISSNGTVINKLSNVSGGTGKETGTFELAQRLWRQISMHEYAITISLPATKAKIPKSSYTWITSLIRFHGCPYSAVNSTNAGYLASTNSATNTSTAFSPGQGYWPRQITHSFDTEKGWTFDIVAVNHTLPQAAA